MRKYFSFLRPDFFGPKGNEIIKLMAEFNKGTRDVLLQVLVIPCGLKVLHVNLHFQQANNILPSLLNLHFFESQVVM